MLNIKVIYLFCLGMCLGKMSKTSYIIKVIMLCNDIVIMQFLIIDYKL